MAEIKHEEMSYSPKANLHFNRYLIPQVHQFYEDRRLLILKSCTPSSTSSLPYFPGLKGMTAGKVDMGKANTTSKFTPNSIRVPELFI